MKIFPQKTWSQNVHNSLNRKSPKLEMAQCPSAGGRVTAWWFSVAWGPIQQSQWTKRRHTHSWANPRNTSKHKKPERKGYVHDPTCETPQQAKPLSSDRKQIMGA